MAMMRSYMRSQVTQQPFDTSRLERLGITERQTKRHVSFIRTS